MKIAIVGIGNIGSRLARDLVAGNQPVILVGKSDDDSAGVAKQVGPLASSASLEDAIRSADAIILAVWFDAIKDVIAKCGSLLVGKVVIDPSNAIVSDGKGGFKPTLPSGQSSGGIIASLLPKGAHYVKAFGTVAAQSLQSGTRRTPERAVLFYATDDAAAETAARELIVASGFDPVKAGGVAAAGRIEVFGDLHESGALGKLVSATEAERAVSVGSAPSKT